MRRIQEYSRDAFKPAFVGQTTLSVGPWSFRVAAVTSGVCSIGLPGRHEHFERWLKDATAATTVMEPQELSAGSSRKEVRELADRLREAASWFDSYSAGRPGQLPYLVLVGTTFQRRVWRALHSVPFGSTRSYGEIAQQVDSPRAYRAVGQAVGANPLPILIPCHRIIGSGGQLVGFGGGLALKQEILAFEQDIRKEL